MKKRFIAVAAIVFLCGCTHTVNKVEETDIITETETETSAVTLPDHNETTEAETASLPDGITSVIIDMNDKNASEYAKELHNLETAEIRNCGSAELDFLRDSGIYQLTIYGFTGRAADYEELFRSLELTYLFIYTEPDRYYETDRDIYNLCVREGGRCIYSDTEIVTIGGNNYPVDEKNITLNAEDISENDCENIRKLSSPNFIIQDVMDNDLSFLGECPNITSLVLEDFEGSTEAYSEMFSKLTELKSVVIKARRFSSKQSDSFMMSAPCCAFEYYCESSDDTVSEKNDSKTPYFIPPSIYIGDSSLPVNFSNLTDLPHTAQTLRIFRNNNNTWEPVPFADGSYTLRTDFIIPPQTDTTFTENNWTMPDGAFDFQNALPGKYKTVFTIDGTDIEMDFIIDSLIPSTEYPTGSAEHMDFLDSEQKTAFEKALAAVDTLEGCSPDISSEYAESHTSDEFLNEYCSALTYDCALSKAQKIGIIDENGVLHPFSGGRGSIITSSGECFVPLYSDENEVLFKNINIHWHGDIPYERWYHEYSFHMIKTEDGWKFDVFQLWY